MFAPPHQIGPDADPKFFVATWLAGVGVTATHAPSGSDLTATSALAVDLLGAVVTGSSDNHLFLLRLRPDLTIAP
ncbi:hypothetical protein OV203_10910 [Nannocystis sp. ILAH1]|uniref:hypothetical protein n=1 Tax=Nannocystis sp. ILAH1 TaxID=2996789 RepID=UPI00226EFC6F|nr:hypothetical protein [Nannocystis sp. ILAH1]MCY0987637.1 hypothetical protein [Nannocystis sp. ILAH1]